MSALDVRRNAVMIDIACNDPDNGVFAHVAEQIQIGQDFIELECRQPTPPTLRELDGAIRLSGKRWPVIGWKYGVGNWCWNGYWFEIPVAVYFLCWLHGRKLFALTTGEERIYNLWKLDQPLDREFLARMLGKPSTYEGL